MDSPSLRDKGLALQVALRIDRPDDTCAAWMDAADRLCGKGAVVPWLCKRHKTIAEKRAAKESAPVERADASKAAWYADQIFTTKERIERAERTIARFEARSSPGWSDALAEVNVPLKQRMRGFEGELKAWRAYESATKDLSAARARLSWLEERKPVDA